MALTQLAPPYPIFTDKNGDPLDNGYLYFGEVNKNPETNPIQVYYDSAFTQPAAQPLRTSSGYVMRNGSPALIYADSQFSVTIRDKNNALVLTSPSGYGIDPSGISGSITKDDFSGDGSTVNFGLSTSPSTKLATAVFIDGVYQEKETYSVSGTTLTFVSAPSGGTSIEVITQETGVIGSTNASLVSYTNALLGASERTVQSRLEDFVSVKDFGAVGDGVTDDTAAIQAAIDAVGVGLLVFPEGSYKTTATLTTAYAQNIKFLGTMTYGGVTIRAHHDDHVITPGFTFSIDGINILRDASYVAAAKTNLSNGINFNDSGGAIAGAAYSNVRNCVANGHYIGIRLWGTHQFAENNTCNDNVFGIELRGAVHTITHNATEANDYSGLYIAGNGHRVLTHYADLNNSVNNTDYGVIHFGKTDMCYVGPVQLNDNNGAPHFYVKDTARLFVENPNLYITSPRIAMHRDTVDVRLNIFNFQTGAAVTFKGTVGSIYSNRFPVGSTYTNYTEGTGANVIWEPFKEEYFIQMPFANGDILDASEYILGNPASASNHDAARSFIWYLPGYLDNVKIEIVAAGLKLYNNGTTRTFAVDLNFKMTIPGFGTVTETLISDTSTNDFGSSTTLAYPYTSPNLHVGTGLRTTVSFSLDNNSGFALLGGIAWVRYRIKSAGLYA